MRALVDILEVFLFELQFTSSNVCMYLRFLPLLARVAGLQVLYKVAAAATSFLSLLLFPLLHGISTFSAVTPTEVP